MLSLHTYTHTPAGGITQTHTHAPIHTRTHTYTFHQIFIVCLRVFHFSKSQFWVCCLQVHDAPLVERVASALMKTQQYEKAGEFFESLDRLQSALDAYSKAHSYRRAVELSRKAFPAQVCSFFFSFFFFLFF